MKPAITIFITKHWDALLASVVACVFIYFFTRHSGIGVSPDSVVYQSAAVNIKTHFSFSDFNGMPVVDFPLGYPCFLAITLVVSGLPLLQVVPVVNAVLFSVVLILTSVIILGYQQRSSVYKILFLSVLAISPCLLEVYSMLWSETLFLFWVVLFMVIFRHYFRSHSTTHLLLAAFVAAFACITRYAGITLLATGGFLLLFDGELCLRKKINHILLFTVTGSSLIAINLLRNRAIAGHITGMREKAIRTLFDNLNQIGTTISDWFPFIKGHETVATVVVIILLLVSTYQLLYRIIQQQYYAAYETIITCFFVVYTFFILTVATVSRFENLSSRLLSPIYIPVLLICSSWIVPTLHRSWRIKKYVLLIIALFFYAGFQYNQYQLNRDAWEGIKDAGIPGYTEDTWVQSPAIAFIKKNKPSFSGAIYANANDAVYFLTGVHALALPHKQIQKEVNAFLQHDSFWLLWMNEGENNDLVNMDFIKQHKKIISVQTLEDGTVYLFADK